MMDVVADHVFPFLRTLGEEGSSYGRHMRDARLGFSNSGLLAKVVEMLDQVPMDDRDTKGDLDEYMLGKIASAGRNGQFRTPRHIIQLMVEMVEPKPRDVICDPAAGTCGFLVAAGEYLRTHHPELFRNDRQRRQFHEGLFHGFDFDATMLRIGAMNMTLHGVDNADVSYRDSPVALICNEWILRVVASPEREQVQTDGRIRRWARIDDMGGRYLRVILLVDGETVRNAFSDRGYKP